MAVGFNSAFKGLMLGRDVLRRENSVISWKLGSAGTSCHEVEENSKILHFQPAEGSSGHCDGPSFFSVLVVYS
jgi:hypothetical protein